MSVAMSVGMKVCELCGLEVEEIPADATQVSGKLYRFVDGSHHLFKKKPKEKQPLRLHNPNREAPDEAKMMGTSAKEVPR